MISEFFLLASLPFWALLIGVSALLIWFVETEENEVGGLTVVVITAVVLLLFSPAGAWAWANPWRLMLLPAGYVLVGVAWTVPRWGIFLRRVRAELLVTKAKFLQEYLPDLASDSAIPKDYWAQWSQYLKGSYYEVHYGIKFNPETGKLSPPTYRANTERLVSWAVMWPWSMFWTFFRDVIVDACRTVISWWSKLYDRMSRWFFTDF